MDKCECECHYWNSKVEKCKCCGLSLEKFIRPWGRYDILLDEESYKVKRITVNPGKQLSLQYHNKRTETWTIVCGSGMAIIGDDNYEVSKGQTIFIPLKAKHRIRNDGDGPLIFIETQLGDYFGEDDIVRIVDDYGRI